MSNMRVFRHVTPEVLSRLGAGKEDSYVADMEPGASGGRITIRTPLGEVVIRVDYQAEREEMTVTILKKPTFLPAVAFWAEMSLALDNASRAK
jgi:hypothetical protein